MSCSLDAVYPPCGPCGICGGLDKRHRVCDAIAEDVRAGSTAGQIIRDYDQPQSYVDVLLLAAWGSGGFEHSREEDPE